MALLVAVLASYFAHIFLESVLLITRIVVVVESGVYQIHTYGRNATCCTIWPSVATIASTFLRVMARKLSDCLD